MKRQSYFVKFLRPYNTILFLPTNNELAEFSCLDQNRSVQFSQVSCDVSITNSNTG